jgi:hypothetical protein
MKKIAFVLVALLMAAPAIASVDISVADGPGPNDITISYDASSEPNRVRAFALEILIDDPCMSIAAVNCVSERYYVYPGSIAIDAGGTVTDWGSCLCSGSYPGTPDEPNEKTIEMGSLYVGEANAPNAIGDLVIITLAGCDKDGDGANASLAENAIRGGVVMEDPDEVVTVNLSGSAISPALAGCESNCQDPSECAGHSQGDSTCEGSINLGDLFALKAAFGTSAPWTDPQCCSDYDNSGAVNLGDLFILKAGFGTSGYVPSTGNQSCAGL